MQPALEPSTVSVILVRPRYAENVGAVARALGNVGGRSLRLVSPNDLTLDGLARRVAKAGEGLLDQASYHETLHDALHDVDLAVATSHKTGRRRKPIPPWDLAESTQKLKPRHTAIVLGAEDHGLRRDEIQACQRLVTIPSETPLNLAQAALLMLYELCVRPATAPRDAARSPASEASVLRITAAAASALQKSGYPHHRKPLQRELAKLTDILARAAPDAWETNFLIGMFKHLERNLPDEG